MHEFKLHDFNEDNKVIVVKYCGCYVIVDNGYLRWSVTVPPIKKTTLRTEIRFSDWVESIRKDVECTFGILKGRWRCLKCGLRLHSLMKSDNIWKTCCALHNMLLEVDGLADGWENGVQSEWETEVDDTQDLPFASRRLIRPGTNRNLDTSGIGNGNDIGNSTDNITTSATNIAETNCNILGSSGAHGCLSHSINKLSLQQFCQKLIRHFNVVFQRKEVK